MHFCSEQEILSACFLGAQKMKRDLMERGDTWQTNKRRKAMPDKKKIY